MSTLPKSDDAINADRERYARAKEIYLLVGSAPPGARHKLIDQQCADDVELTALVQELLNADAPLVGRLEEIANAVSSPTEFNVYPRISGLKINRLIAKGGSGLVFEAEQERPSRRVAVKLIRPEFAAAAVRTRFEREADLLGRLRHPYIAQIFGFGVAHLGTYPVPFISMEYVEGCGLRQFLAGHDLAIRKKLKLFAQICEGVHHAHLQGVIHRDLKPENILVDSAGRPRIVDFGIARLIENDGGMTTHTTHGQIIGSLPYLSPEQATGNSNDTDARSDVYSLGVIAYELFAGKLPYPIKDVDLLSAVKMITASDAPHFSVEEDVSSRDLWSVVQKAMRKAPHLRYQSAHALKEDIMAVYKGHPVDARESTLIYSLFGLIRRHRKAAAATGVFITTFVVAAVAIFGMYHRQLRATRRAELEERIAQDTTQFVIHEVNQHLQDILGGAKIRREILRGSYERLSAAIDDFPTSHARQKDLATAITMLGVIDLELERPDQAESWFERADELLVKLLSREPDDSKLLETYSHNLIQLGNAAGSLGRQSEIVRRYYEHALKIDEQLVQRFPENRHLLNNLSWSYQRLGALHYKNSEPEIAFTYLQKQQDAADKLVTGNSNDVPALDAKYDGLRRLEDLFQRSDQKRAKEYQMAARQLAAKIYRLQPRRPRSMHYEVVRLVDEGNDFFDLGQTQQAIDSYCEALDLGAELFEAEPDIAGHRNNYNRPLYQLADIAEAAGCAEVASRLRHSKVETCKSSPQLMRSNKVRKWITKCRGEPAFE